MGQNRGGTPCPKKGMDKKVVETPYTDIYVTVRTTRSADGSTCRIAAIASDCRGKGLPGAKQRVQKLNSASERQDIERATAFVIARALDAYIQAYPQQQAPALSENIAADTLLSLYQQFHEAGYPVHPDWRPGTNHSAKLAFKRTIPHICAALADGCDPQNLAVAIHDRVRDDVQSNANARDRSSIDKTVRKNMLWCDAVLNAMRLAYPGRPELEIRLNVPDGHGLSVLREQAKALPQNVREALAEYLTDCCRLYDARLALTSPDCANPEELRHQIQTLEKVISDENPRYVLVMLMMYDAGLRTSEAAAVTGDSLRLLNCAGHHATSLVLVQCQARDGKRCRILKSENAYRTTVLSHWGHVMVQSVLRYLAVFDSQWPQQVTDPKGASAWILQRLRVLGVSDCCLSNTAASLMAAGEHGLLASEDLSAYILRRDCATRWAFRCGLSLDTIDILLGHARYGRKSGCVEYRDTRWLTEIAYAIERYVHVPEYSAAPKYMPYLLSCGTIDIQTPYPTYCYRNTGSQPVQISIAITAQEPGEAITLCCSGAVVHAIHAQDVADAPDKRMERTIFTTGDNHDGS